MDKVGVSLISGNVVKGIIVLVLIIVGVIFATSVNSDVRSFINSIKFWEEDEVKESVEALRDVYNECRRVQGDNCLCVSNLDLDLKQGSIWVESVGTNKKDYGVWFTPSNVGVPEVQHCLSYTKFDANEPYYDEFDEVAHFEDNLQSEIFFSSQGYIEERNNKGYNKGAIKVSPVSLFKHFDKQKQITYLCLVPLKLGNTPTCDEVMQCSYDLCGANAICPNGNVDKNYQGKGECCMQACREVVSQVVQDSASVLYQEGLSLLSNKKYTEAYAKFREVYENYKSTTVTDDSLYYIGEVLVSMGKQEEGLIVWRDLLIEYNGFKDNEYGNSFYTAEQESDNILDCGKGVVAKEGCLQKRDSLLKGCYWKQDHILSFVPPDGFCESCGGVSCRSVNEKECGESFCTDLGNKYCEWSGTYGNCGYSHREKVCSDYNDYPLVCKLAVSADFKESCEWIGTECVSSLSTVPQVCNLPTDAQKAVYAQMIIDKAIEKGVDPILALSIAEYESGGLDPNAYNEQDGISYYPNLENKQPWINHADYGYPERWGAYGLFQILLSTAIDNGFPFTADRNDLFDPETNIEAGLNYIKKSYDKYGTVRDTISVYNSGRSEANAPDSTKQNYIPRVMNNYQAFSCP
ncbi:MAG: transglycosylase SLT domain-containing protein [Nanoarchaeota archaeon]